MCISSDMYGFWWGNLKERAHLEDLSVDVSIVLKYILNKCNETVCTICLPQNNTDA